MGTPQNFKQIVLVRMPGTNQLVATPQQVVTVKESNTPGVSGSDSGPGTKVQFVASPQSHPVVTPQKVTTKSSDSQALKPPKPPDKPLLPYVRFSRTVYEQVKSENPELKLWEIGKIIGQMWRDLPDDEKSEYVDKYKTEKIEYEKNYKAYLVSPAYLAYTAAKAKGESQASGTPQKPGDPRAPTEVRQPERKAFIESVEEEEDSEDICYKHMVACARYSRNYRLIEDIFSEAVVPSEPPTYTVARIQAYRGHVAALTKYVSQLQNDIRDIEEKFEEKKRKIAEATEAFEREMKRLRK